MKKINDKDINPRWLSVRQSCRYASMSDKTIMKYVLAGYIWGAKKGGKWYIDRFSIDAFFHSDDVYVEDTLARLLEKVT